MDIGTVLLTDLDLVQRTRQPGTSFGPLRTVAGVEPGLGDSHGRAAINTLFMPLTVSRWRRIARG